MDHQSKIIELIENIERIESWLRRDGVWLGGVSVASNITGLRRAVILAKGVAADITAEMERHNQRQRLIEAAFDDVRLARDEQEHDVAMQRYRDLQGEAA